MSRRLRAVISSQGGNCGFVSHLWPWTGETPSEPCCSLPARRNVTHVVMCERRLKAEITMEWNVEVHFPSFFERSLVMSGWGLKPQSSYVTSKLVLNNCENNPSQLISSSSFEICCTQFQIFANTWNMKEYQWIPCLGIRFCWVQNVTTSNYDRLTKLLQRSLLTTANIKFSQSSLVVAW
jgi:hypothetical protein